MKFTECYEGYQIRYEVTMDTLYEDRFYWDKEECLMDEAEEETELR